MANPINIQGEQVQKVLPINENGSTPLQVAPIDSNGNFVGGSLNDTNGIPTGTLFGINSVNAQMIPTFSGNWSVGIPAQGFRAKINTTGRWFIVNDGANLNGACQCETGTNANGFFFGTSTRLNRYENGRLSFYLGTFSFNNVQNANGNFELLVGAMYPGLVSQNRDGEIKEGICFGFIKKTGEPVKAVGRVYKNYVIRHEFDIDMSKFPADYDNLKIYHIRYGYLGIHPFQLLCINTATGKAEEIFSYDFLQDVTSVSNPDMAFGVFAKNSGNTENVYIRNGSFSFGMIGNERVKIDSSARRIEDSFQVASIPAVVGGTIIATYRVPEIAEMIKEINSSGTINGNFINTKNNILLFFDAVGLSNKPAKVQIYFAPASAQTGATYTKLNPLYNLLERATGANIGTVNSATFKLLKSFSFNAGNFPIRVAQNVTEFNFLLEPGGIAVIVVQNSQTVTDFEYSVFTEDLF